MSGLAKLFLSQNHLNAIGLVATEWSYTEACLEFLIWELAGLDEKRGQAITTHLQSETRIQILQTLADSLLTDAAIKKRLTDIIAEIRNLRIQRNDIVHGLWIPSTDKPISQTLKNRRKPTPATRKIQARGTLKVIRKPVKSKEIRETAKQIGDLAISMFDLLKKMQSERQKRQALAKGLLALGQLAQNPDPTTTSPGGLLAPSQE